MTPAGAFEAELKAMSSTDLPDGNEEPPDPASCRVEMILRVGPLGDDSGDDFTLFFVTPAWLAANTPVEGFRVLKYTIVVPRFEWPVAERASRGLVGSPQARSWEEFLEEFSRSAYWEYSDDMPASW